MDKVNKKDKKHKDSDNLNKMTDPSPKSLKSTKSCPNQNCLQSPKSPKKGIPKIPSQTFQLEKNWDFLHSLSFGIAFVDDNLNLIWENQVFKNCCEQPMDRNKKFYQLFGENIMILGPDFCPFSTVRRKKTPTKTTIRINDRYFELCYSAQWEKNLSARQKKEPKILYFIVEMRDITEVQQVDEIIKTIIEVGRQFSELSPDDLKTMTVEDRRILLKDRIEHSIRGILKYDVVEIRLLDEKTNRLDPLLAFGMAPEAVQRVLYAEATGYGITGYVAHFNKPYNCEETLDDNLYIEGAINARSSLTVPMVYHSKVIGTCNVESLRPSAFTERDCHYLLLFAKNIAAAIHNLDLLSFENERAILDSLATISDSLALPIDHIISDLCVLINDENSLASGNSKEISNQNLPFSDTFTESSKKERLQQILNNANSIRDQIISACEKLVTTEKKLRVKNSEHPVFFEKRILMIDSDEKNLQTAHLIFEDLGAQVQTATDALTALIMLKIMNYDLIICEIHPSGGMNGYQLLLRLIEIFPAKTFIPILFAQPDGRDAAHIVPMSKEKCREIGFEMYAIHKPIIKKQLITNVEKVFAEQNRFCHQGNRSSENKNLQKEHFQRVEGFCAHQRSNRLSYYLQQLIQYESGQLQNNEKGSNNENSLDNQENQNKNNQKNNQTFEAT
ncbi:MAG: GAF domain-containing protein [Planctomycetia bacterium]|nr:GAF domain-containing protein [Planctomycetia bacterium]